MLPPDAKMGSTNISCRHCDTQIDLVDMRTLDPNRITPDGLMACPYCSCTFYPGIGLLHSLYRNREADGEYFGLPLSIGGAKQKGLNRVEVGKHQPITMSNLKEGYEYDSVFLLGAHRSGVDEENWLPYHPAGSQNRANLGDDVLISLLQTGNTEIAITASLQDGQGGTSPIGLGDELDVVYDATTRFEGVTNPTWVDLLIEAQDAIREGNTLAALPVLRSAVDNCLIRQAFIHQIWVGEDHQGARDWIENLESHEPNRITIANHALEETTGTKLAESEYSDLWEEFDQIVVERDAIIHSETASNLHVY